MNLKRNIKDFFEVFNLEISKFPAEKSLRARMKIINQFKIDLIFDIGANVGQYAMLLRKLGYKNQIVSFEPMKKEFNILKNKSINDSFWEIKNCAIGDTDTEDLINISGNSVSSSLHKMKQNHIKVQKKSEYIGQEKINVKKIDSFIDDYSKIYDNIFMKVDTQGNEYNVIKGSRDLINKITGIQMEMSIIPLYENEKNHIELIKFLDEKGFVLFSIEPGFSNSISGQLLQYDGIFIKRDLLDKD